MNDDSKLAYQEYQKYISKNNNLDGIYDVANSLGWTTEYFFKKLIEYIDLNFVKPRYAIAFNQILDIISLNNDTNINMFLYRQGIEPYELQINLNNYLTNFRPDIKYTNKYLIKLRKILIDYQEYYNILNTKQKEKYTINYVKMFINSPYSLDRFFMARKISSNEFMKYYAISLKKENKDIYNKLEENIILKKELKKATIQNDILLILNLIKELGNNFTSIDLFKNTMFSPKELIKTADKFLNYEDLKLFRNYINNYTSVTFMNSILKDNKIKDFINSNFSFNIDNELIETTKEMREIVINDLKEYCIPITYITFIDDYGKLRKSKTLIR